EIHEIIGRGGGVGLGQGRAEIVRIVPGIPLRQRRAPAASATTGAAAARGEGGGQQDGKADVRDAAHGELHCGNASGHIGSPQPARFPPRCKRDYGSAPWAGQDGVNNLLALSGGWPACMAGSRVGPPNADAVGGGRVVQYRIVSAILAALVLFGLPASSAMAADFQVTATVNLRSGPGTNFAVIGQLAPNQVVSE